MEPIQQRKMQPQESQIDFMEIIALLLSRFWLIVFMGVLGGLLGLFYTKATTTPVYTSSTKIYVLEKGDSNSSVTGADLALGATLASDYAQLIKDKTVAEGVIAELGLDMSPEALISSISVTMPNSGRIITISVSNPDPYLACKLVTSVRELAAVHIKEVMNSEAVNVVEEAKIPQGQISNQYVRFGSMGAIAGMAIVIAIVVVSYLLNDTIKSPKDVEHYLNLSVLGSIPTLEEEQHTKKERKKESKKERTKNRANKE